jgi:hypothetical protein
MSSIEVSLRETPADGDAKQTKTDFVHKLFYEREEDEGYQKLNSPLVQAEPTVT